MAKPTVLFEINPFLVASSSIPEFIQQSISMAQKFEDRFGGVSLKLSGSTSIDIIAEFRWQGTTVIKVRSLGSKGERAEIAVFCPNRVIQPSTFLACDLGGVFDSAFLDVINQQLMKLNNLKADIESRDRLAGRHIKV